MRNESAERGKHAIAVISCYHTAALASAAFKDTTKTGVYMAEESQTRVDLSGIHPLKRVTLIMLGFLFGLSLTIALTTQFWWMEVAVRSPRGTFIFRTYVRGLVLAGFPDETLPFEFLVYQGGITGDSYNESHQRFWFWFGSEPKTHQYIIAVPGIEFTRIRYPAIPVDYYIRLHHAWLITITAALYFFTRWRIRRSARIQNQPS